MGRLFQEVFAGFGGLRDQQDVLLRGFNAGVAESAVELGEGFHGMNQFFLKESVKMKGI